MKKRHNSKKSYSDIIGRIECAMEQSSLYGAIIIVE